ncbi:MAG TPA: methionyl-tRNA formyltransferase [Gelria sp.]|nr:methionyl-tRNA formyltransferase [Gelria sp.]
MNIVYMGTSVFAVPSLQSLITSRHQVVGVVSQPDRPRGRGKRISPTPVKKIAQQHGIPVYQPARIKEPDAIQQIKSWQPELIVVVSYGQIIPPEILEYPAAGCINVHASLLPRYRGAAPIQRALMDGEKISGITTMFMDEGLDTGDIILQLDVPIKDEYDHGQLEAILAEKGALLLGETIDQVENGTAPRIPQNHELASYASRITREDEKIDWSQPAESIHNQIRALSPRPGAWTNLGKYKTKIYKSRVINNDKSGVISQIIEVGSEGFSVQSGKGIIEILEVQREGRKRMPASDFLRGYQLQPGTLLA